MSSSEDQRLLRRTVTVVTGCYNEQENVEELYSRVRAVFDKLDRYEFEMLFIDNASQDNTFAVLRKIAENDKRVKVILNARNFGAIRSGFYALTQAKGDAVIAMASDLQDPPELIADFIAEWEKGYKVVLAIKTATRDSRVFYLVRSAYYKLVKYLSNTELNEHNTGFGLYDRQVMEVLRKINDPYPYFRGLISEIGFESAKIPFTQPQRARGITKNNFYALYDLAMLGFTSHSKVPLRIAALMGFAMSFASLLVGLGYLVYKLLYWDRFSAGLAPVVIGLFLFSSVQLFFIGILGEYIGAIHTQVLNRPLVVEKERINC